MKQIIIFITFLTVLAGCSKAGPDFFEEKIPINNEAQVLSSSTLNTVPPDGYKTFISRNKKLMFFYKEDWKCNEVVYNIRIDCYPLSRVEEEYDAGLDENIVYYPDISFYGGNELCNLVIDNEKILKTQQQPLVYNEFGDNYYSLFYKKFNDCPIRITTLPYIDVVEKLEEIIK